MHYAGIFDAISMHGHTLKSSHHSCTTCTRKRNAGRDLAAWTEEGRRKRGGKGVRDATEGCMEKRLE